MCRGMFDLANKLFYPDYDKMLYGEWWDPANPSHAVERRLHRQDAKALDKKSVEPEETSHQQSESAKEPEVRLAIEEVEEEDGAMLNKCKVTVVMKKPHA
ncbi:hypothetical protein N0V85_007725 [Neurospora sp. IMI 360204]|nr:hypothetical protein N0V85_007725 [Neurospora sp. IMI 360204]